MVIFTAVNKCHIFRLTLLFAALKTTAAKTSISLARIIQLKLANPVTCRFGMCWKLISEFLQSFLVLQDIGVFLNILKFNGDLYFSSQDKI